MNRECNDVMVKDCESGEYVKAMIYSPINDKNIEDYNSLWRPFFDKAKEKLVKEDSKIEDSHWDWGKKIEYMNGLLAYKSFALEVENITQGMMIIETVQHFSKIEYNKHLIYIEFLSTAPCNRKNIVEKPKYSFIGSVLVFKAVRESLDRGFEGKVGLASLPLACLFYENLGFKNLSIDSQNNLKYFELSKEAAEKTIEKYSI